MRLSRTDLVPALAIIGGGAVCVLTSGALLLASRAEDAPTRVRVVVPVYPDPAATLQREEELRRRFEEVITEATRRSERWALHRVLTAVDEAIVQVEELQRQQREMIRDVRGLSTDPRVRSAEQIELLRERKDQMDEAVQNVELALDGVKPTGTANYQITQVSATHIRQYGDPEAVRNQAVRMAERAAELIRESKLVEELQFSRGTVERWDLPSAVTLELNIEADLQALRAHLDPAREPAEPDLSAEPTFTPFTVAPGILNMEAVQRAMVRAYPMLLREAGIGGTVRVYFFIDESGWVQSTRVDQSSGHQALDDAARAVAGVYRFSAALNGGQPVPVWVTFPITFRVR